MPDLEQKIELQPLPPLADESKQAFWSLLQIHYQALNLFPKDEQAWGELPSSEEAGQEEKALLIEKINAFLAVEKVPTGVVQSFAAGIVLAKQAVEEKAEEKAQHSKTWFEAAEAFRQEEIKRIKALELEYLEKLLAQYKDYEYKAGQSIGVLAENAKNEHFLDQLQAHGKEQWQRHDQPAVLNAGQAYPGYTALAVILDENGKSSGSISITVKSQDIYGLQAHSFAYTDKALYQMVATAANKNARIYKLAGGKYDSDALEMYARLETLGFGQGSPPLEVHLNDNSGGFMHRSAAYKKGQATASHLANSLAEIMKDPQYKDKSRQILANLKPPISDLDSILDELKNTFEKSGSWTNSLSRLQACCDRYNPIVSAMLQQHEQENYLNYLVGQDIAHLGSKQKKLFEAFKTAKKQSPSAVPASQLSLVDHDSPPVGTPGDSKKMEAFKAAIGDFMTEMENTGVWKVVNEKPKAGEPPDPASEMKNAIKNIFFKTGDPPELKSPEALLAEFKSVGDLQAAVGSLMKFYSGVRLKEHQAQCETNPVWKSRTELDAHRFAHFKDWPEAKESQGTYGSREAGPIHKGDGAKPAAPPAPAAPKPSA